MKYFLTRPARPKRNVQCLCFLASAGLVATMLAQGMRVRTNILSPHEYVVPFEDVSVPQLHELLQDSHFKFIATVTFLVSPTGSNQTFNVPTNWNSGNNKGETIGSGASGGAAGANAGATTGATGGGAGAYSAQTNIVLTPGGTATYQIATAGNAVTANISASAGHDGASTWFNGTTLGGSSVGAVGGSAGQAADSVSGGTVVSGASGGAASSGVGATKKSGGGSGGATVNITTQAATGGGGAGGPNGDGSTSGAASNSVTNGGAADGGTVSGGAAGSGGNGSSGNSGTEFDGSHGCGSGGGGSINSGGSITAGSGANYGGGGGGASISNAGSCQSGGAGQGLIVVTNTPASRGFFAGIIG